MDIFSENNFYPNEDVPFLEHFKNCFESVFVTYSPFFKIKDLNFNHLAFQKSHKISLEDFVTKNKEFSSLEKTQSEIYSNQNQFYPNDETVAAHAELILWEAVIKEANFADFSSLNKALLTSIGHYRKLFRREDLSEQLHQFSEKNAVFQPSEGNYNVLSKVQIYNSLKQIGKTELVVIDEYLEIKKDIDLAKMSSLQFANEIKFKDYYIYAKDKSVLFSIDWDSFFYIICSAKNTIDKMLKVESFEGFFCTNETTHSWEWEKEEVDKLLASENNET